jgi:hypothetical protein
VPEIDKELAVFDEELNALAKVIRHATVGQELQRLLRRRRYLGARVDALRIEKELLLDEEAKIGRPHGLERNQSLSVSAAAPSAPRLRMQQIIYLADHNQIEKAKYLFSFFTAFPNSLDGAIEFLRVNFARIGRLNLLLDWLLATPQSLSRVSTIGRAMEIAVQLNRSEAILKLAFDIRVSAASPIRWSYRDRIKTFRRAGADLVKELLALKYVGIPVPTSKNIFRIAEDLSARIDLDHALLRHLYAHRLDSSTSFADWDAQVRTAFVIDHMISDQVVENVDELIDADAKTEVLDTVASSKGMLLVTFHGAFLTLARKLFSEEVEGGITFASQGSSGDARRIAAKQEPREALFLALRAVQEGKALLMAPDAQLGKRAHSIEIAGIDIPVANGGAFIAYETGCDSAWFTVIRRGNRFLPVLSFAPKPNSGESFGEFSERWLRFYGQQVEAILLGNPQSSSLELGGLIWPLTRKAHEGSQETRHHSNQ